jgi:hypothetical protein
MSDTLDALVKSVSRTARLSGMCTAYARVLRRMRDAGMVGTDIYNEIFDEFMAADEDFAARQSFEENSDAA